MKLRIQYLLIAVFSIFVGSQITEAVLLVPFWKSLSTEGFYDYYAEWGPKLGKFYTILTVIALLIPIGTAVHFRNKSGSALIHAMISTAFAILFIAMFYLYFKDINQHFLAASLSPAQLKSTLTTWGRWHWVRVLLEIFSLGFLCLCFNEQDRKATPQ